MRTKFVDACLKVESRYPTGGIDGAVQNNRTIGVIQGDFSREASLLVFSIQGDIFVIVVAVINGGNQPFQQYGWVLVFVMAAVDIQIESYFTQFFVYPASCPAQTLWFSLHRNRQNNLYLC